MNQSNSLSIIVPAFNEEKHIGDLIKKIKNENLGCDIIVVDDGSSDNTSKIARHEEAQVISHVTNLGQWAALKTGFTAALMNDVKIIVMMDSDGQHDPEWIKKIVSPIISGEADIVSGSRFIGENNQEMPKYRELGITVFNNLLGIVTGMKYTDCTNGFKAIKAETLRDSLRELHESQYGALEFLLKTSKQGARIMETPIPLINNPESKKGKIKFGLNLLRTFLKYA